MQRQTASQGTLLERARRHDFFSKVYDADPPWDIGRAQPAIATLAAEGEIHGSVLDVGCGTGDNALHLAGQGFTVTGIDISGTAVADARRKAKERALHAEFNRIDALDLAVLDRVFDTIIDSGFFHTLDDVERTLFDASLHNAVHPGTVYHLLCFSELVPDAWGPRRVTRVELESFFSRAWEIDRIRETRLETRRGESFPGWLATAHRVIPGVR